MGWKITRDLLTGDLDLGRDVGLSSRVGYEEGHERIPLMAAVVGIQSGALPTADENGEPLPQIPFRVFDDDGELYYEGLLHDDDGCENQSAALHYAETDAGCTTIKVKRGDAWVQEIA